MYVYPLCVPDVLIMKDETRPIKRVQVSFTNEQWKIIERLRETMGAADADMVRNIVLAWLAEKSIIATDVKRKIEAEEM